MVYNNRMRIAVFSRAYIDCSKSVNVKEKVGGYYFYDSGLFVRNILAY